MERPFPFLGRVHGGPWAGRTLALGHPLVSGVLGLCMHLHLGTHRCVHYLSGVHWKPGCVRGAVEAWVRKRKWGVGDRDWEWLGWGHL